MKVGDIAFSRWSFYSQRAVNRDNCFVDIDAGDLCICVSDDHRHHLFIMFVKGHLVQYSLGNLIIPEDQ